MAIRFGLIITLLTALFAFQNCAKAPMTKVGSAAESTDRSIAALPESKTFYFHDDYDRVAEAGAGEFALDVESGEISFLPVDSLGSQSLVVTTKFCLDEEEKTELRALLSEDQVCSGAPPENPDTMCSAIYRPSYAKYGSQTQSVVPVGEALSACQVKADFCSGNGERIRRIIEQVKASLDTRVCAL